MIILSMKFSMLCLSHVILINISVYSQVQEYVNFNKYNTDYFTYFHQYLFDEEFHLSAEHRWFRVESHPKYEVFSLNCKLVNFYHANISFYSASQSNNQLLKNKKRECLKLSQY